MRLLAAASLACLLAAQEPTPPADRKAGPPVTVRLDSLFETGHSNQWHTLSVEVTNHTPSDQEFRIFERHVQGNRFRFNMYLFHRGNG